MSTIPQSPLRKQAGSQGNGVPQWLLDLGIGPGEFFLDAKPRARGAMKCSGWTGEMGRVYSCLSLHTMAYASQVAVRIERGRLVPIGPKEISHEASMERRQVRRALAALESGGFIERAGEQIIVFALPRSLETPIIETTKSQTVEYPADLPDYLIHYLRRFRPAQMPDAAVLEELKPLCSSAVEIETKIKRILKPETDDKTEGRKCGASGHKRSKGRTRVSALCSENISTNPNRINEIDGMATGVRIERKERKNTEGESSSSSDSTPPLTTTIPPPELSMITSALHPYCRTNRKIAETLIQKCREVMPLCSVAVMRAAIEEKGPLAKNYENRVGFMLTAVPDCVGSVGPVSETAVAQPASKRNATDATMDLMLHNLKTRGTPFL